MRIAFASDDKKTISEHFGAAPYLVLVEVAEGEIVGREIVEKLGHKERAEEEESPQTGVDGRHGFTQEAFQRHEELALTLGNCKAVIAGRMGLGAYENLRDSGLEVIITDIKDIDEAVSLYIKGELPHLAERLH
ncbi:MAG: NifB/NifX family molybdenum-iron cluster-binding protein [Candidatus Euphemobacter frigidus]|nr:NifB/NifX family molybdenum-iron cluster-binding protein [Candidatus Euphemobacter frigidus]